MAETLLRWVVIGLLTTVVVYVAGSGLQLMFSILPRKGPQRGASLALGILSAASAYVMIVWFCFQRASARLPTVMAIAVLGMFALGVVGLGVRLGTKKGTYSSPRLLEAVRPAAEFAVAYVFLAAAFSFLVSDPRFPVVTTWNNDIWSYSKYAQLVISGPAGDNIVGTSLLSLPARYQTPLAFVVLASVAELTGQEVFDVLTPAILMVLALSAVMIKNLCVRKVQLNSVLSGLVGLAWATSSFVFYLTFNFFLAQILGVCFFLLVLTLVFEEGGFSPAKVAAVSLSGYLAYMAYPVMFLPYVVVVLLTAAAREAYERLLSKTSGAGLPRLLLAVAVSIGISFVADPTTFRWMVRTVLVAPTFAAGWPLSLLSPFAVVGLPAYMGIDAHRDILKVVPYAVVVGGLLLLCYRSIRGPRRSSELFSMHLALLVAVGLYLAFYVIKGPTYQAWKFAGSFVLPLSFLPVASVFTFPFRGKPMSVAPSLVLAGLLVGANAVGIFRSIPSQIPPIKYAPLRELTKLDRDPQATSFLVDLKNDFQGSMLALQFISRKPVRLTSRSYYSEDGPLNARQLTTGSLLVTQKNAPFDSTHMVDLGEFGAYGAPIRVADTYTVDFASQLPSSIQTTGMGRIEGWGRWSDSRRVTISLPVSAGWRQAHIVLRGSPFIGGGAVKQRLSILVSGKQIMSRDVSSDFELPIDLGEGDVKSGQVSLGLECPDAVPIPAEGVTVMRAFGFRSMTVTGR